MNIIKKINKILFSVFVAAFMFYIIKYPKSSTEIVLKGLNLCYLVIIPVIFPFLAFSKMFINSYLFRFLGRVLNKPARFLFGISGEYANAFLIGGIAGFPIGAKTVKEVYLENNNKNEAERTLAFCNNCSVSFAVSAVGVAVFGSFQIGLFLFCIQLFSAIVTGIIIRFMFGLKNHQDSDGRKNFAPAIKSQSESSFTEILSDSVNGILNVCGTVLFFFIVANITFEYLKFMPFFNSGITNTAISGIFEISSGIYSLINFNSPAYYKLILSSIILSWTGISVHFQIMYTLKGTKLSLIPYFTGKIIHAIISVVTSALAFKFIKTEDFIKISEVSTVEPNVYAYPMILNNFDAYTAGLIVTEIISLAAVFFVSAGMIICFFYSKKVKKTEKNNNIKV